MLIPQYSTSRLIDRLVDGASPTEARRLLCIARNALTARINAAIIAEYDAEIAANPGADFAQMAGRERQRERVAGYFQRATRSALLGQQVSVEHVDELADLGGEQPVICSHGVPEAVRGDGAQYVQPIVAGQTGDR